MMSVQSTAQTGSGQTTSGTIVCVDLDGTLIAADLLWEPYVALLKRAPMTALLALATLAGGRSRFKRRIASAVDIDASTLPYRTAVLEHLDQLRQQGARLVLATASDERYARAVADHLDLFDEVHASDGQINLSGRHKAAKLVARFGQGGFSYIGNDWSDIPVWHAAVDSAAVAPTAGLARHLAGRQLVSRTVGPNRRIARGMLRGIRSYQWVKNLLVFVPLLASHRIDEFRLWFASVLAFVAFSLCASAIYLANDIPGHRVRSTSSAQALPAVRRRRRLDPGGCGAVGRAACRGLRGVRGRGCPGSRPGCS
jgi:phosphoserine phosphatase